MAYKLIEAAQSLWRRQLADLVGAQLARDLRTANSRTPRRNDRTGGGRVKDLDPQILIIARGGPITPEQWFWLADGAAQDNGPGLISPALQQFCADRLGLYYSPPGTPWNNGDHWIYNFPDIRD